jgi:hypothetical protein
MRKHAIASVLLLVTLAGLQPAWAQLVVTDPATTLRNAITAAIKSQLLQTLRSERDRFRRMAARLSAVTTLTRYVADEVPRWRTHDFESDAFLFARGFHAALNYGDSSGDAFIGVARVRAPVDTGLLDRLPPSARDAVRTGLATLDAADSALIAGTHQTGTLRFNGRRELAAINVLEQHVVDPSDEHSLAAVLDKVSGAVLLESRQQQARLQLVAAITEQLVIENKRTRDAETGGMNMQLRHLRDGATTNASLLSGAGGDLRTWRQP